jgi:hypothetical protein
VAGNGGCGFVVVVVHGTPSSSTSSPPPIMHPPPLLPDDAGAPTNVARSGELSESNIGLQWSSGPTAAVGYEVALIKARVIFLLLTSTVCILERYG